MNNSAIKTTDPHVQYLIGGTRPWFDITEKKFVPSATLYVAFGCPDWGEKNGSRTGLCTFCALPNAVIEYKKVFYGGKPVPNEDHISIFRLNLAKVMGLEKNLHTLMIFNAGSFLAMDSLTQREIIFIASSYKSIRNVVIESRAELITEKSVSLLAEILKKEGKLLTIRVGVETQNDRLRLKVLKKGHSRKQLYQAVAVMKKQGVRSGGYALLKPAPSKNLRDIMKNPTASEDIVNKWAVQETRETLNWILGNVDDDLGMDEVYYCSTNVGPDTPLEKDWRLKEFTPATLWMVYEVLALSLKRHGRRIHLLPFTDEPPFLAVSSNHVKKGVPEDLTGAQGCDHAFHQMFSDYRRTMDSGVLKPPHCLCRPNWLES